MKAWKKGVSLLLVATMCASLTACGGGNGQNDSGKGDSSSKTESSKKTSSHFFKVDYLPDVPATLAQSWGTPTFIGDTIYYYYGATDSSNTQTIASYSVTSEESKDIWTFDASDNSEDLFSETLSLNNFTVDKDGNIFVYLTGRKMDESKVDVSKYENTTKEDVINYMVENWGYGDAEEAEKAWDEDMVEYYGGEDVNYGKVLMQFEVDYESYIVTNYVKKIDASGNEVFSQELDLDTNNGNTSINGFMMDGQGYLYISIEEWSETEDSNYILVVDGDGNQTGKIDLDNYVQSFIPLTDGSVAAYFYSTADSGYSLCKFDGAAASLGEPTIFGDVWANKLQQKDDTHYWMSTDEGLILYDTDKKEKELYCKWMDYNITGGNVGSFYVAEDGTLYVQTNNYSAETNVCEIARLQECDESEVTIAKTINIACYYMNYELQEAAIEFNKKHEDLHINVNEYYADYSEMDWQDGINQFSTDIATDTSIDAVIFYDFNQMLNFASKGLLIDLYDVMGDDAEVNKDTILPNILAACEMGGKLMALPNNFSVQTLLGRTSEVGAEPGWTVKELLDLYKTKPEGTLILPYMTRDEAMNSLLSLAYRDFIDVENNTCSFNTEEFQSVLEFAKAFPEEYEYSEDMDDTQMLHDGKIMLYQTSIPEFGQTQMLTEIFGEPVTYIGYPTENGNGTMLYLNNVVGITKNCEDPQELWGFLRELFVNPQDWGNTYNGSILKSEFDKWFDKQVGSKDYEGSSWGWGDFEVTLHAPTQEEVDMVKEVILNTTSVSGAASTDITNIIKEEAASYFSGEKTAEEVSDIIQSRMQIYLSETN